MTKVKDINSNLDQLDENRQEYCDNNVAVQVESAGHKQLWGAPGDYGILLDRECHNTVYSNDNLQSLELRDIIDMDAIQSLADDFYRLTNIPMSIIDLKGKVLVVAGWQDVCTKFHRANEKTRKRCIESDSHLSSGVQAGKFKFYKCWNGMWHMATPLIVGGRKLANLISSQYFFDDEKIDYDFFKNQAAQYGFEEIAYIDAVERVTRISREKLSTGMDYFVQLADLISRLSYANLKLTRSLADRDLLADRLNQSQERLGRAQEIARLGSWEMDLLNNKLFWSDEVYRILGLAPDECKASYKTFLELVPPEDRDAVNAVHSNKLNSDIDVCEIEHRIIRKSDGEVRIIHEKFDHYRDSSGRIVRSFGMVHDITERKHVENNLREAHDNLEKLVSERTVELMQTVDLLQKEIKEKTAAQNSLLHLNKLYALLSETNHIIVRTVDRDTLFSEFCQAAVDEGGFVLAWVGIVDQQDGQVKISASCGKTAFLDDIKVTVKDEPHGLGPTGISIREGNFYICNDFQNSPYTAPWHDRGTVHGVGSSASVALKVDGMVFGALTLYAAEKGFFDKRTVELLRQIGADISFALDNFSLEALRRQTEQALQDETLERLRTVEALREKEQLLIQQSRLAAMGEMIGNIAHQWRQPLNLLALKVQQMQIIYENGLFTGEYLDEVVKKSMRQILHMSQTIDDFRNYFIPDKEKILFSPKEVVAMTFELLKDGFKQQHIQLELQFLEDKQVFGFPNEYSQALLNILLNAKDALLAKKTPVPRVVVAVTEENGKSVVLINDNAGGIPEGVMDKIFDPYFTTKGLHEGTGVGLFMSRTIIEKNMQGRLTARNTAEGAEFRVEV